jgi:DGQHR domain-containing protein
MRLFGIKYKQINQEYISTVMPLHLIIDNYRVLEYGKEKYGYQRAPKLQHYKKIADAIINDINTPITPSSIILGINEEDLPLIFDIIEKDINNGTTLLEMNFNKKNDNVKFRIIDGQHRIKGLERAIDQLHNNKLAENIRNYNINVIVMISKSYKRKPEVEVFSSINAKAKPIKMDLTILAEYEYDLIEESIDFSVQPYLAVKTIYLLNSGENCKNWKNAIIIDPNSSGKLGCVGFKSFYESIIPVCKLSEINLQMVSEISSFENKKDYLNIKANDIAHMLGECWIIVFHKWNVSKEDYIFDSDGFAGVFYDEQYYLQRNMGVLALNRIICDCFKETNDYSDTITKFKTIIMNSKLTTNDWSRTGKFSGMSSLAGVSKIIKSIKNEE